ncbi:hypothetical protein PUR61_18945 [Streptomyces sp. BE20]|uniref:hypothetical protein n=1 Tax=Streptomyces sp. BE20 TaxID=3002525 RepID=UPI002E77BB90|nr:hypothetical protein [Streptomyces sp. BE20]MEE1824245.1 hypothetical protein [Streptomyces sp. BE20]
MSESAPGAAPGAASGAASGERPLAELLDTFWQGRVPPPVDDGREPVTALDELGPTGITVRGRPLDAALAVAYRRFTGAG